MKNITIGITIGVLVTITVLSVWAMFKQNSRINDLELFSSQVATLINNAQKAQTK